MSKIKKKRVIFGSNHSHLSGQDENLIYKNSNTHVYNICTYWLLYNKVYNSWKGKEYGKPCTTQTLTVSQYQLTPGAQLGNFDWGGGSRYI